MIHPTVKAAVRLLPIAQCAGSAMDTRRIEPAHA
jgi:hypothetical protein